MKQSQIFVGSDLLDAILPRLPIKTLVRFKSVCKTLKKMIEDPCLALTRAQRRTEDTDPKLLMVHYSMPLHTKDQFISTISNKMIEITTPRNQQHRLDCDCNGLYLFYHAWQHHLPLVLFNPLTQETLELPHASSSPNPNGKYIGEVHGFGFDVVNAVLKVIRFTMDHDNICRKPEILILGQKSWKQLELPACLYGLPRRGAMFLNGCIHCLFERPNNHNTILVAFDVTNEAFRSIKFPRSISSSVPNSGLILNVGGYLAVCVGRNDYFDGQYESDKGTINIWLLIIKDYHKGEWCIEHVVIPNTDYIVVGASGDQVILLSDFGIYLLVDTKDLCRRARERLVPYSNVSRIVAHASQNQLSFVSLSH